MIIKNIDFDKLFELAYKKKTEQIDITWHDIGIQCGITNGNIGDRARSFVKNNLESYENWVKTNIGCNPTNDPGITTNTCSENGKPFKADSDIASQSDEVEHIENGKQELYKYKESVTKEADGTIISNKPIDIPEDQIISDDDILRAHNIDPEKYYIYQRWHGSHELYSKRDGVVTLCSSKIIAKPFKNGDLSLDLISDTIKNIDFSLTTPSYLIEEIYDQNATKLFEFNITDLHLGKFACLNTTGTNYNLDIASKIFNYIIDITIQRVSHNKFKKTLFIFSHDFFNIDNLNNTTTKGTPQTAYIDGRLLLDYGIKLLREAVLKLLKLAPVEVIYVGANHDKLMSYAACLSLKYMFENDDRVTVREEPVDKKICVFGNTLIGFMHEYTRNSQNFLARDFPVEWGQTKYHELHVGHIHTEQTISEKGGSIVRALSSPTGTDKWHYENGYTGAMPKAMHFVYDYENGLEDIVVVNVPEKFYR